VAVSCVEERTVNELAATAPKLTAVVPLKLVPVTVTTVPPKVEPLLGEIAVTVGAVPV
jgi:hypothetical protein